MTEYTLPRLPAQSDARRFSTLSAPLLFCHCLKEQQPTTSQPTASQPTTQPELTTQQTLTGQQTLTTQQTLTGQRLEALTFVTLTGCRCGEAEVEKDSGCNDRLSFYLACFEVSPQPDWQFCLALSDEACAQPLVTAVCSAQHASTSDPHITISRSGGENLEGVSHPAPVLPPRRGAFLSLCRRLCPTTLHLICSMQNKCQIDGI